MVETMLENMIDLAGRLNKKPGRLSVVRLCMIKDTGNNYLVQPVNLQQQVKFSENVSCLISTTNCCGLLTPAASIESEKLLYGFLIIRLNVYSKFQLLKHVI